MPLLAQAHPNKLPSYKDVALFFHLATYLMICTIKVTDARKSTTAQSVAIWVSFLNHLTPRFQRFSKPKNSGQSYTKALVLLQAQEIRTILHQGFSTSASPRIRDNLTPRLQRFCKPKNSSLCLVGWLWAHHSNVQYNIMKPWNLVMRHHYTQVTQLLSNQQAAFLPAALWSQ